MNNLTFIDIATIVIALWGAFLSSYLAIREIKKEKRKVEVSCSFSIRKDKNLLLIRALAVNAGHRPVTISSIGFQFNIDHPDINISKEPVTITPSPYPDEDYLEKTLPKSLSDGEVLKVEFPSDSLLYLSDRAKGKFTLIIATDAEGRQYSSPLPDDIYKYLNYNILDERFKLILDTHSSKSEPK